MPYLLDRRSAPQAAVAAAFVAAFAFFHVPWASADAALTVAKAAATADNMMPVNVGDELGIFRKHGLALKILDFNSGSKMAQAVAAGSIDLADGAGSEMALIAKGAPMKAVCEDEGTFPFLSVGVPVDSAVTSAADLKGRKMGVSSPGSLTDWLAQELARKEGWGPDDLKRVGIGSGTASVTAAFRDHLVDADISATSLFLNMEEKKIGRLLIPVTDFEGDAAAGMIYASDRLITANPGAIRAFLAGWLETIRYMRAHKAETVKIESGITGFSPAVMGREYDLTIGMFKDDCRFDPQGLATLRRSFIDLKLLAEPPDMAKLYTDAFVPN
ncbi:MAG TPA: ABC transporter substrate-binding protein [Stellaceae bacterium]|nr:ABC transporter substrate-binding protein [Stellaceae bacterium]